MTQSDGKTEIRRMMKDSLLSESLELTVEDILNASLDRGEDAVETTRKIMASVVEGLSHQKDGELKIRALSETAVLAVARRWGNVVQAGKATVEAAQHTAQRVGMNHRKATEEATIGAADGVRRVGPVVFPKFRDEVSNLVEDFDQVIGRSRNLPAVYQPPREHPIIVPLEGELELLEELPVADVTVDVPRIEPPSTPPPEPPKPKGFFQKVIQFFRGLFSPI